METILCPLATLLRARDDEDRRLYAGMQITGPAGVVGTIAIVILVCFVLALVGMVKAFGCGSSPTSLGLTGTGWGALILVLVLLLPPIGSLLGLMVALTGKCLPELVRV